MAKAWVMMWMVAGCDSYSLVPCGECASVGAVCNPVTHTCQRPDDLGAFACDGGCGDLPPACATASDCVDPSKPLCVLGACRACSGAAQDAACAMRSAATPRCLAVGAGAGRCVACLPAAPSAESSDCSAASTPICNSDGTCRRCAAHGECASKVCLADGASAGSCAPAASVALIDNGNVAVATCQLGRAIRDGNTPATAYCDVSEVVNETAKRPYARVAGSAQPYGAITLTDRSLTLVGPGPAAAPPARLFTLGVAAVNVTVNSGATVVLDGLDLGGDSVTRSLRGLACTNNTATPATATLVLRSSTAHDSAMEGVQSNGCALTVSASAIKGNSGVGISVSGGTTTVSGNTVSGNSGGGISIIGAAYSVVNNFIVDNGTSGPGVLFSGNLPPGLFWFNTIAGNLRSGGQGGAFNCGGVLSGTPLIQASIIWGNTKTGAGSSVGAGCAFRSSDLDDTPLPSGAGNFGQDPKFVASASGNYRITSGSPCIDQVTVATGLVGGPLPAVDADGTARPRVATGGYDVGAFQVTP